MQKTIKWLPHYSLRALFVAVTLFALWLGWELKVVRDRQEARRWVEQRGGNIYETGIPHLGDSCWVPDWEQTNELVMWRRWLGDQSVTLIFLPSDVSLAAKNRIRSQFPEAEVLRESPSGTP